MQFVFHIKKSNWKMKHVVNIFHTDRNKNKKQTQTQLSQAITSR